MNNQSQNNFKKALEIVRTGKNPRESLSSSSKDKQEIKEIAQLIDLLRKEQESIEPPKEILKKIITEQELSEEKKGRFSTSETLSDLIINYLKSMNQKSKLSIVILGVFALLIVGVIIFGPLDNSSRVAKNSTQDQKNQEGTIIATTSAAIGEKEIDKSINSILNEALSEEDLDAELSDIELAISETEELEQINNLFNDNEL